MGGEGRVRRVQMFRVEAFKVGVDGGGGGLALGDVDALGEVSQLQRCLPLPFI